MHTHCVTSDRPSLMQRAWDTKLPRARGGKPPAEPLPMLTPSAFLEQDIGKWRHSFCSLLFLFVCLFESETQEKRQRHTERMLLNAVSLPGWLQRSGLGQEPGAPSRYKGSGAQSLGSSSVPPSKAVSRGLHWKWSNQDSNPCPYKFRGW